MNNSYDNQDKTGQDLSDRTDMDNLYIEGLCLSQSTPHSAVLPPTLMGTTFSYCNLDNVEVPNVGIPGGNVLEYSNNRMYAAGLYGQDWELDENDDPWRILGTEYYVEGEGIIWAWDAENSRIIEL